MENSNRPPAMRNAGSDMPRACNSQAPIKAAPARMVPAIRLARIATRRRALRGSPCVTARNVGASPSGSRTTTIVTKAETKNSNGMDDV